MKKFLILCLCLILIQTQADASKQKKNILVTGGAGFLGSHLCERLVSEGHTVYCLDNLFTGCKENINHLCSCPNFHFIYHDIIEPYNFDIKLDEIYNLACPASPVHYQEDPVKTLKTTVLGTLAMLELATKHKAKIFQASTSEIYGDAIVHPQNEKDWGNVNPIGIRSCYDEGKRAAETLCFDYHRQYQTRIKVARIFNTYGPKMNLQDGRVVSNFIVQALNQEPITIYGEGKQTRSFCYVSDLIDAFLAFMNADDQFIGPVNLGNDQEYTILELAVKILKMTNSKSQIIFQSLPEDDPKKRRPDISLAKEKLHWSPKIPIEEGLKLTIPYFQKAIKDTKA